MRAIKANKISSFKKELLKTFMTLQKKIMMIRAGTIPKEVASTNLY